MKKAAVYVETYGCTLNQADSDMIKAILVNLGYSVTTLDEAEVIILNTCTVKGPTENKILERIRKLETAKLKTMRASPASPPDASHPRAGNPKLVLAGCMASNPQKIRMFTDAPIVWPGAIGRIGDAVEDALCGQVTEYRESMSKFDLPAVITKPIVRIPIAEGCTGQCTFCQTKIARPGLRSFKQQTILNRISQGVRMGAREVQLTAMDTGAYGLDTGTDLISLLSCVNEIEGEFRVRLGMINPDHVLRMKQGLMNALKGARMYKFFHVPVQSGSERICMDMGRKHTVSEFESIVSEFRAAIPEITIATDVIVGYPTESEDDFLQTLDLLGRVRPNVVNLSKFSPRFGTKAKELKQLDSKEVKRRSSEANGFVKRICAENNRELIGKEFDVLITEKKRGFTGRTMTYKQVVVKDFEGELGEFIKVKITDTDHGSLFGKII